MPQTVPGGEVRARLGDESWGDCGFNPSALGTSGGVLSWGGGKFSKPHSEAVCLTCDTHWPVSHMGTEAACHSLMTESCRSQCRSIGGKKAGREGGGKELARTLAALLCPSPAGSCALIWDLGPLLPVQFRFCICRVSRASKRDPLPSRSSVFYAKLFHLGNSEYFHLGEKMTCF